MFNLSFDDEESVGDSGITLLQDGFEELHIERGFFDKLPKEFEKIVGEIKSKASGECPKLKSGAAGAFGQVEITSAKVKKLLNLIQNDKHNILLMNHQTGSKNSDLYFLLNRLNNYCKDINEYVKLSKKYFPDNFTKIFKCNRCNFGGKQVPYVYVEMETGKGSTFKEFLNNPKTLKKDIASVIIQTYYISLVLNMNKLYHNDLKPANIIVSKSTKTIVYDSLRNSKGDKIIMTLPKGKYYPVIVDYDLVTKGKARPAAGQFVAEEGSADYDFFAGSTKKVMDESVHILRDLPDFDELKEIKKSLGSIYQGIKKHNKVMKVSYNGKQNGGAFPLVALKAAKFLKSAPVLRKAATQMRNPAFQQRMMAQGQQFVQQNPQLVAQAQQQAQQFMQQNPQFQQQLNQRYQQMQQPQFQYGGGDELSEFLSAGIENLSLNNSEVNDLIKDMKKMKVTTKKGAMTAFEKLLAKRGKSGKRRKKQNGGRKKKRKSKK